MTAAACASPCENCDRTGLPILFTRYAAAYSAQQQGMQALQKLQPRGHFHSQPAAVALKTALYGVRMLRAGYLYVHIERGGAGSDDEWKGYAVHPHGYLAQFDVLLPQSAKAQMACARTSRQANASMVWVRDAAQVKKLWYLFHPDPLAPRHLLDEIAPNLGKYMHSFDVAAWLGGNTSQPHSCQAGELQTQVMEFAAIDNPTLQTVGVEQHYGLMGVTPQEREWGNYLEKRKGRHFHTTATGAAMGPAVGPYTVAVTNPPYAQKHGPRLEVMRQFLTEHQGAVLACYDPIGIAQELSLHHLSAAIPYASWLQEVDKNGYSNQWKQAASNGVRTIRKALAKQMIKPYDDITERSIRFVEGRAVSSSVEKTRRAKEILQQKIDERQEQRPQVMKEETAKVLQSTKELCDWQAMDEFDAQHTEKLEGRDGLMNKVAQDLNEWLKSDAFIDRALGLYSDKDGTQLTDGMRCAGQLCAILLQLDSTDVGKKWYAQLDTFTPDKKNLVWRMLCLNNAAISQGLQAALKMLIQPLPPATADEQTQQYYFSVFKSYEEMALAIKHLRSSLSTFSTLGKILDKASSIGAEPTGQTPSLAQIGQAALGSMHSVLTNAVAARFKALPVTKAETLIVQAQLLLMVQGMGTKAVDFTSQQMADAKTKAAALNAGQNVAEETADASDPQKPHKAAIKARQEAKSQAARQVKQGKQMRMTQQGIEKGIRKQIAATAAKDMRLPTILLSLNALAMLPALAKVRDKGDVRSTTELLGSVASAMGNLRQWRADLYDKAIYQKVPDLVPPAYRLGMAKMSGRQLEVMKASAARVVAAGAAVGVFWDVVDAMSAFKEEEDILTKTYLARSIVGISSIGGTMLGVYNMIPRMLLLHMNLFGLVATSVLTIAIWQINRGAWARWLQAQPFRKTDSPKIPHVSEEDSMQRLSAVVSEMD